MIKNIIFDIGNVIVKWQPAEVVAKLFPNENAAELTQAIFKSQIWYDLNLGKFSELEAINKLHLSLNIDIQQLNHLMYEIKESLLPVDDSFDLLTNLTQTYSLYALTDNVHEIVSYLKNKYEFWNVFKGIVVSAEVGFLKPMQEIYSHLIELYQLNPAESIFIDDLLDNVNGAKSVGMHGIQFLDTAQCIRDLKSHEVIVYL